MPIHFNQVLTTLFPNEESRLKNPQKYGYFDPAIQSFHYQKYPNNLVFKLVEYQGEQMLPIVSSTIISDKFFTLNMNTFTIEHYSRFSWSQTRKMSAQRNQISFAIKIIPLFVIRLT